MKNEECRELDKISMITTFIILIAIFIYLLLTDIKLFIVFVLSLITMTLTANELDDNNCEEEKNE